MTNEAINILGVLAFLLVGGGSFLAGYLSRYLFSNDYDAGYCQGYEDGKRIQRMIYEKKDCIIE